MFGPFGVHTWPTWFLLCWRSTYPEVGAYWKNHNRFQFLQCEHRKKSAVRPIVSLYCLCKGPDQTVCIWTAAKIWLSSWTQHFFAKGTGSGVVAGSCQLASLRPLGLHRLIKMQVYKCLLQLCHSTYTGSLHIRTTFWTSEQTWSSPSAFS